MSKYLNKKGLTRFVSKIKSFVDQKLKDLDIDTGLYAKQSDMEAVQAVIPDDASSTNQLVTSNSMKTVPLESMKSTATGVTLDIVTMCATGHIVLLNLYALKTTASKPAKSLLCSFSGIPIPKIDTNFVAIDVNTGTSYLLFIAKNKRVYARRELPAGVELEGTIVYCY